MLSHRQQRPPGQKPPRSPRPIGLSPSGVIGAFLLSACGEPDKHLAPRLPTRDGRSGHGDSKARGLPQPMVARGEAHPGVGHGATAGSARATVGPESCSRGSWRRGWTHLTGGWAANHLAAVPANFSAFAPSFPGRKGGRGGRACGRCCAKPGLRCLGDPGGPPLDTQGPPRHHNDRRSATGKDAPAPAPAALMVRSCLWSDRVGPPARVQPTAGPVAVAPGCSFSSRSRQPLEGRCAGPITRRLPIG